MDLIIRLIAGLVATIHSYILWLEMFAWTTRGPKAFNKPLEELQSSKTLAANQGLYNGFLAAGLIWTFFITNYYWQSNITLFFLACVAVGRYIWWTDGDQKDILYPIRPGNCWDYINIDKQVNIYKKTK